LFQEIHLHQEAETSVEDISFEGVVEPHVAQEAPNNQIAELLPPAAPADVSGSAISSRVQFPPTILVIIHRAWTSKLLMMCLGS
jgi:hypothetical protein